MEFPPAFRIDALISIRQNRHDVRHKTFTAETVSEVRQFAHLVNLDAEKERHLEFIASRIDNFAERLRLL